MPTVFSCSKSHCSVINTRVTAMFQGVNTWRLDDQMWNRNKPKIITPETVPSYLYGGHICPIKTDFWCLLVCLKDAGVPKVYVTFTIPSQTRALLAPRI